jgi:hypothetical protein
MHCGGYVASVDITSLKIKNYYLNNLRKYITLIVDINCGCCMHRDEVIINVVEKLLTYLSLEDLFASLWKCQGTESHTSLSYAVPPRQNQHLVHGPSEN